MHTKPDPIDIIRTLNELGDNPSMQQQSYLISCVCRYFDAIKYDNLTQADLKFLQYIAHNSGIPQFYDMLSNYQNSIHIIEPNLNTISNYIYEKSLEPFYGRKLHKYQKQIYDKFEKNKINRYFLSASTSFGKTHLLFDIIQKMQYQNIVLIFPTIALLAENLERIYTDKSLQSIKSEYLIHTLSDVNNLGNKNLFIFTPERFLSYLERDINSLKHFDFVFIDEFYKIDNGYEIDEQQKENERDIAYRMASFYALSPETDILLVGPYINVSQENQASFSNFLNYNNITYLDYNNIEIVSKTPIYAYRKIQFEDDNLSMNISSTNKQRNFLNIMQDIFNAKENALVYCYSRSKTEEYAKKILENDLISQVTDIETLSFLEHIGKQYSSDWIVYKCLKHGIGIHHGLLPKYIQKETISLFNKGVLKVLLCTTTITEGVNTSAKNLVVLASKKGNKALKPFDAKNIVGRAGRFMFHYSGRIIILDRDFDKIVSEDSQIIQHKNYDKQQPKTDVELALVDERFLNDRDKREKNLIEDSMFDSGISPEIFEKYKTISALDKIKLFNNIIELCSNPASLEMLQSCIIKSTRGVLDCNGFELVLNCIKPIITNKQLLDMIEYRGSKHEWSHSLLTIYLKYYLKSSFIGLFRYKLNKLKNPDQAMRVTADFVYHILKYQLVKYLGVFNLLYTYIISIQTDSAIEDIVGFDKLLAILEYNALSDKAKIVSDYGCTSNIVSYFEEGLSEKAKNQIKDNFDKYEQQLFQKITEWIDI